MKVGILTYTEMKLYKINRNKKKHNKICIGQKSITSSILKSKKR